MITLPGSVASLNVVGRTCANAGAAKASAGTSSTASRAPLILNFIVGSFLYDLRRVILAAQALCHVMLPDFACVYSLLEKSVPDCISARLEVASEIMRKDHQIRVSRAI
jgi:hypothetical protein